MGRYYDGDIQGKFWFAVQPSNDAEFFGAKISEPNYVNYQFDAEDLPTVEEGIANCLAALGVNKAKLDAAFDEGGKLANGYSDEVLSEVLGLPVDNYAAAAREVLGWYARLELGEKIRNCIVETGQCYFEAEL